METSQQFLTLLHSLKTDSPVRQIGEELVTTGTVTDWTAIHRSISHPSLFSLRELQATIWMLANGAKTDAEVRYASEMLTGLLHVPSMSVPSGINLTLSTILTIIGINSVVQGHANPIGVMLGIGAFSLCIYLGTFMLGGVLLDKLGASAAQALAFLKDPASLNSMAESQPSALDTRPESVRWTQLQDPAVSAAIPHVASALNHSHYGTLTKRTTRVLCGLLQRADNENALRILHGLRVAATGSAVNAMEAAVKRMNDPELRAEAQATLDILIERQRNERDADRLLRPSTISEEAPAYLLRPAQYTSGTDPELLLRPLDSPQ